MYGRQSNNIFANNSSNSYNNNNSNSSYNNSGNNYNSSYSNNNNSYSSYNNNSSYNSNRGDRIGSYRTNYKPEELPSYLTSVIEVWKSHPPISIAAREELLHLSPTEIRIEDYILIRNKKLNSQQDGFFRDAVRGGWFNQELMKNNCHNPLPYSRDNPYSIDAIKVMAKRSDTANTYGSSSYGNYGNSSSYGNNSSGNNSSSYNTRSNNIFSNNGGSNSYGNNNNSSSNNIFSRNSTNNGNSGGNNIFSNNNNSSNNSSSNNIFSSNNNSNNSSTNIFNRNSNTGNNNNYNNNSSGNNIFSNNNNNNNNASNNIFNRNNNGSNIFNNNNNNNSGGNNIFNNNNNNGGSNNIFANNNNNNNNRNNLFSNNNNNGNNLFNNNNNGNIFNNNNNPNNNSLFNNNNPYNQMDPRFLTELQTYMKNVNQVVRKLNGSLPQANNPSSVANQSNSIFSYNESVRAFEHFDPYQIDSYTRKKRQDQEIFVAAKIEDKSMSNSQNSHPSMLIEEVDRSQIMENSQMGGQRLKNSYMNHSKIRGSTITNNDGMKGSKIISNQSFFKKIQPQHAVSASNISHISNGGRSKLHFNSEPEFEQGSHMRKSRYFHEVSEGPCECLVKLSVVWVGVDLRKCDQLFDELHIRCSMNNLLPNQASWKTDLVQKLKQENPTVRSDAELNIIEIERLEGQGARFSIIGELHQRLFNIDSKEYQVMFRNVKKGLAYNLCISNEYGTVSWDFPVDVTQLQFAEGGEFSIEDNAIICEKEALNAHCHVTFRGLPEKIRSIVVQNGGDLTDAKRTLEGLVAKKSSGKFQLIDIWIDGQNREAGWSMAVSKFT